MPTYIRIEDKEHKFSYNNAPMFWMRIKNIALLVGIGIRSKNCNNINNNNNTYLTSLSRKHIELETLSSGLKNRLNACLSSTHQKDGIFKFLHVDGLTLPKQEKKVYLEHVKKDYASGKEYQYAIIITDLDFFKKEGFTFTEVTPNEISLSKTNVLKFQYDYYSVKKNDEVRIIQFESCPIKTWHTIENGLVKSEKIEPRDFGIMRVKILNDMLKKGISEAEVAKFLEQNDKKEENVLICSKEILSQVYNSQQQKQLSPVQAATISQSQQQRERPPAQQGIVISQPQRPPVQTITISQQQNRSVQPNAQSGTIIINNSDHHAYSSMQKFIRLMNNLILVIENKNIQDKEKLILDIYNEVSRQTNMNYNAPTVLNVELMSRIASRIGVNLFKSILYTYQQEPGPRLVQNNNSTITQTPKRTQVTQTSGSQNPHIVQFQPKEINIPLLEVTKRTYNELFDDFFKMFEEAVEYSEIAYEFYSNFTYNKTCFSVLLSEKYPLEILCKKINNSLFTEMISLVKESYTDESNFNQFIEKHGHTLKEQLEINPVGLQYFNLISSWRKNKFKLDIIRKNLSEKLIESKLVKINKEAIMTTFNNLNRPIHGYHISNVPKHTQGRDNIKNPAIIVFVYSLIYKRKLLLEKKMENEKFETYLERERMLGEKLEKRINELASELSENKDLLHQLLSKNERFDIQKSDDDDAILEREIMEGLESEDETGDETEDDTTKEFSQRFFKTANKEDMVEKRKLIDPVQVDQMNQDKKKMKRN